MIEITIVSIIIAFFQIKVEEKFIKRFLIFKIGKKEIVKIFIISFIFIFFTLIISLLFGYLFKNLIIKTPFGNLDWYFWFFINLFTFYITFKNLL